MADLCLPLVVPGACGYCRGPLTLQPAGDAACDHCRALMDTRIVGPTYEDAIRQFQQFARIARRHRERTSKETNHA